jgi:hypothetical protein
MFSGIFFLIIVKQLIMTTFGLYIFFIVLTSACSQQKENPILVENMLPGTKDWLINVELDTCSYPNHQFCRRPQVEGYCSEMRLTQGDTLRFYVSTNPPARFNMDIYRMGYYQGNGGSLKKSIGPLQGSVQKEPEPDSLSNYFECDWDESCQIVIPRDWLSGVYLCKLTTIPDQYQSYIIFIVKDRRQADFIFQCADLTWQSYNRWPYWHSLYDEAHTPWKGASSTTLTRTSFDRPYALYVNLLPSAFNPLSNGSGEFLLWEFPLSFWMEQEGYDVTYISNIDTDTDPEGLLRGKAFLSVGHDEYWTYRMVENVKQARDKGVNILFLSGNSVSGAVYLDPSNDHRPDRVMGRTGGEDLDDRGLMGAVSYGVGYCSFVCQEPDHWLFERTGMRKGDSIENLVGWEYHGRPVGDQKDLIVVGENQVNTVGFGRKNPENWTATIYTAEKGNFVFNAGTCWWVQPLARTPAYQHPMQMSKIMDFSIPDPRVQQMTRNLFIKALSQ